MANNPVYKNNVKIHESAWANYSDNPIQRDSSTPLRSAQNDRALVRKGRRISFVDGTK
jgi:hypothetical protein